MSEKMTAVMSSQEVDKLTAWKRDKEEQAKLLKQAVEDRCENDYLYCRCCGCPRVQIRGRHPHDAPRVVCPTCAVERLEAIAAQASPDFGKTFMLPREQEK